MKKYEDPIAKVILFEDKTFVENGSGISDGGNSRLIDDGD